MLGLEKEAKNGKWAHPFTDVSSWADPYVGCAYDHKLTDGVSKTKFGGEQPPPYKVVSFFSRITYNRLKDLQGGFINGKEKIKRSQK